MCVCDILYICVCEVKIFLPLKKGTIVNAKHKHVSGSHFLSLPLSFSLDSFTLALCPNLSSLFSLVRKKKRKKNRIKFLFEKGGFFQESHHFLFLLRGIILSLLRVYSKERVGEKGEDKRV